MNLARLREAVEESFSRPPRGTKARVHRYLNQSYNEIHKPGPTLMPFVADMLMKARVDNFMENQILCLGIHEKPRFQRGLSMSWLDPVGVKIMLASFGERPKMTDWGEESCTVAR